MKIDEILNSTRRPVVIAHRGASFYHHENTMEAFEAALDMQAEMAEFDVRRTVDGELVVHHNPDLSGREIRAMSGAQVAEVSKSAGYAVPSLVDVLRFCKDRIPVDIELKERGYEEQALETVLGIMGPDSFIISSSHERVIAKTKELHPEIRTGLVLCRRPFPGVLSELFPAARVRRTGADILVVSEKLVRLGFLRFNKGLGKPVWVYTINDRRKLWDYITDGRIGAIFTDRPDVGLFLRDLHVVSQKPESTLRPGSGQGSQEPE